MVALVPIALCMMSNIINAALKTTSLQLNIAAARLNKRNNSRPVSMAYKLIEVIGKTIFSKEIEVMTLN